MWDSWIERVRGQQTSSVIVVCEGLGFSAGFAYFPLNFSRLWSMALPVPAMNAAGRRHNLETETSHNIVGKEHKDMRTKSARQETRKEACVQFKAMRTEKSK